MRILRRILLRPQQQTQQQATEAGETAASALETGAGGGAPVIADGGGPVIADGEAVGCISAIETTASVEGDAIS